MKTIFLASAVLAAAGPARAFADLNFDATTVEPDAGFETIPPGWYNVMIDESSMKPTKDGAGTYLELRFNVIDGQYANRKVYTRLNLKNSNVQTVEIAQKQLSAICHAVGVLRPAKSEELHGIPLKGKVKIVPASGDYEAKNEFNAYRNINEQVDQAGAVAGGDAPAAPAQPWAPAPAAALADPASAAPPAQPWAAPAPAAPTPAAILPHDSIAVAEGDGWIKHPTAPGFHYRGQEVVATTELAARGEYSEPVTPATPPPPAAEPAPAAHDPVAAAEADGWVKHPDSPQHHYKGQDVKLTTELAGMYPAPAAAPAAPAAPSAPAAPPAAAGGAPTPPWATPTA